jgi:hypothetical protein
LFQPFAAPLVTVDPGQRAGNLPEGKSAQSIPKAAANSLIVLAFSRRTERDGQDPCDFELPMTRADMGDFLGLTVDDED